MTIFSESEWHYRLNHQHHFLGHESESSDGGNLLLYHGIIHSARLFWHLLCPSAQCKIFFRAPVALDTYQFFIDDFGSPKWLSIFQRFFRYHDHMFNKALHEKKRRSVATVHAMPYGLIFKQCFPQCFNVFFTYFVTLTIFPAVLAGNFYDLIFQLLKSFQKLIVYIIV